MFCDKKKEKRPFLIYHSLCLRIFYNSNIHFKGITFGNKINVVKRIPLSMSWH